MSPTERITSLTPEQEHRLVEYRDQWYAIGASTEPADRPTAERAIGAMYHMIGEAEPRFIWVESPAAACILVALVQRDDNSSLGASLWDSLWDSLWASLGDSLWASLGGMYYGGHESYWPAYYAFCREIGVQYDAVRSRQLDLWCGVCRSCGWWLPYRGTVICCERHRELHVDARQRLHCESGPAMRFADGYAIWAWHGVRVPQHVIEQPDTITVAAIDAEPNVEMRRVLIERYGTSLYLTDSGATMIHRDDWGTLYRRDQADDEPLVMVKVVNSTPEADGSRKDYFLRVPPTITRAREAVAWTFDMTEREYILAAQT